jgi:hypothetical protein
MPYTILIIAPPALAEAVAEALRGDLEAEVEVAPQRRAGLAALRRREYVLVVLEESLADLDPRGSDLLYQNAGTAPVLEVNFASAPAVRVVRQARSALAHRAQDAVRARAAAVVTLQNELGGLLAGILLEAQLAQREAAPEHAWRLKHLVELAADLRNRLRA